VTLTPTPPPVTATSTPLPRIAVVTASLNRMAFLDEAMRSVLDQGYPELEYAVIDGGSTDGTVDVIRKYADRLTYWVSEKDNGHFHALNKGFARTSGEVMAWINSDDKFTPWAFQVVGEIFAKFPQVEWLTTLFPLIWDGAGRATNCRYTDGFSREGFWRGEYLPREGAYAPYWIQQESTFWRRSLWEKAGGRVDDSLRIAGDFELWARFFKHADLYGVTTPLGGFRIHGDQFTGHAMDKYLQICERILTEHGGKRYGGFGTWLLGSRLSRYVPASVKRVLNLQHPRKLIVHQGAQRGWTIKTVR
jgi:glycosyltransferase involved in cell wall biosynthesis